MKFSIGDKTDCALVATLAHEMIICQNEFNRFISLADKNIQGNTNKKLLINLYSAYVKFIQSLYEFYVGCFKRERKNTKSITHEDLDSLLNIEVNKLLRNKRAAIINGYAPQWENDISYYQIEVPDEFSKTFRIIRNRASHTDYRRAKDEGDITLKEFFKKYHRFVMLLFESACAFWTAKDIESQNWMDIEKFIFTKSSI